MKKRKNLHYAGILFVLFVILLALLFIQRPTKDVLEVEYAFKVDQKPLLKVWRGLDYVDFGVISPTATMTKTINLTHSHNFPMAVAAAVAEGETEEWVEISVPHIIPVGSYVIANVSITPPENTTYGNYSGTVIFTLTKAE